jgi:hypothetical protein
MVVAGEAGTILEDMIFAVHVHLPEVGSAAPPTLIFDDPENGLNGVTTYQMERLHALVHRPWDADASYLDFLNAVKSKCACAIEKIATSASLRSNPIVAIDAVALKNIRKSSSRLSNRVNANYVNTIATSLLGKIAVAVNRRAM